jgi:hypothetical protein
MLVEYAAAHSKASVIREIQIKMTLRFHFTAVRLAKIKTQLTADAGKDVMKKRKYLHFC